MPFGEERLRRPLLFAALAIFVFLVHLILRPFAKALAWAVILTLALHPVHVRLARRWPRAAPVALTLLLALGIAIPVWFVGVYMADEAESLAAEMKTMLEGERSAALAEKLRAVPLAGSWLASKLEEMSRRESPLQAILSENREALLGAARSVLFSLGRVLFQFFVCIFSCYFLFRHGDSLGRQLRDAVLRLGGPRMESLLGNVRITVRAVVYGIVLTAIAQGALAAIGFWFTGVSYPLLLGGLTVLFSFIPFGPPFIWLPAAISLYARGSVGMAIAMFLWGLCVVSTIDNILRPIFIGQATRMPVLLVFIGVLGGLAAFGMLGLFLGPVLVAVTLALWRDWVRTAPLPPPPGA